MEVERITRRSRSPRHDARALHPAAMHRVGPAAHAGAPSSLPRSLTHLQRLAGNQAVGRMLAGSLDSPPGVHRQDAATTDPGATGGAPSLHNPRFVGDTVLDGILAGEVAALSARHNGRRRAVGKVQHALKDSGFDLPLHRVDGSYGSETEDAIEEFRAAQSLPAGRTLDGPTLARLDAVAPAPGSTTERTVDYDRLLEDSRLTVTVAFGHSDETAWSRGPRRRWENTGTPVEEVEANRFRQWLRGQGFELELLGLHGVEEFLKVHTFTWQDASGVVHTREADVWVRVVTPGQGAAEEYGRGVTEDEITMYSGHARYGSGPDFDPKDSPVENFRIGIDAAMAAAGRETNVEEARRHGVAIDEEHDLVEMVASGDFDRDRYRVLFFNACTSMAYLDELRSEVGGAGDLDVVGTRRASSFSTDEAQIDPAEVQLFLAGILAGDSMQAILAAMDQSQVDRFGAGSVERRGLFTMSGFGDNPVHGSAP